MSCEFEEACKKGDLIAAKKAAANNPVLITEQVMVTSFFNACEQGNLDLMQWLLSQLTSITTFF